MGRPSDRPAPPPAAARPRRSCLSVPASAPKMLAKAATLPADEVFLDLEDSVAPAEKEAARNFVVEALRTHDWGARTVAVRINAVETRWAHADVTEVVGVAGEHVDCLILPKVDGPGAVEFVDHLLRMIEEDRGLEHTIGIEAQIESPAGLSLVDEIAFASERLEALVFGPGDMAAALGMPSLTVGDVPAGYPGDPWQFVLMRILVAARTAGLQAIDGPYARLRDLDGLEASARRARALGYDGKWVVHPGQIDTVNEVFSPTQEEYERAEAILDAYQRATEMAGLGAVVYGDEMVDEASRKMAEVIAGRGRAARLPSRARRTP